MNFYFIFERSHYVFQAGLKGTHGNPHASASWVWDYVHAPPYLVNIDINCHLL